MAEGAFAIFAREADGRWARAQRAVQELRGDLGSVGPATGCDVAIWGATNTRAALGLGRIADACVAAGLRTTILWRTLEGRAARTPDDFPAHGVAFHEVRVRYGYGPLRHPHPAVLPLMTRDVARELTSLRPGCIITQLDHRQVDRVWQYAARRLGIPGIVVQEGMANVPKVDVRGWSKRRRRAWTWEPMSPLRKTLTMLPHPLLRNRAPYVFAEYACVWGEAMRRHLESLGRDPGTIFVTGSPAFDEVHAPALEERPRTGRVLFAQQRMSMPLKARLPHYASVVRAVAQDLGLTLVFKLHPNSVEERDAVSALVRECGVRSECVEIVDSGDAVDYLKGVDAVIVATSTTAYHALVAGTPLVVLDYYSDELRFDTGGTKGAAVVVSPGDLGSTLRTVLYDDDTRKEMREDVPRLVQFHLSTLDGLSAQRTAAAVCEVLDRHSGTSVHTSEAHGIERHPLSGDCRRAPSGRSTVRGG